MHIRVRVTVTDKQGRVTEYEDEDYISAKKMRSQIYRIYAIITNRIMRKENI